MTNKQKTLIFLVLFTLTLPGCFIKFNKKAPPTDGGVWKSVDAGENWQQKVALPTVNGNILLNTINIISMEVDPQDREALYINTREQGLFYSYDGAESWFQPEQIKSGRIEDIKVDPESKCIIYASQKNNIYKSTDCNRSWQNIFVDPRSDVVITALGINYYDSSIVLAGNSSGDILRSLDYGASWKTVERLGNKIVKIMADPENSDLVYLVTLNNGIFKSYDQGVTWEDLSQPLKEYNGALGYRHLIFSPSETNTLIHASDYGLLKSSDGGLSWDSLRLITPEKKLTVTAVAVDPLAGDKIYYTVGNTFVYSVDGGVNWKSKKLPTTRSVSELIIDPENPSLMYMSTYFLPNN